MNSTKTAVILKIAISKVWLYNKTDKFFKHTQKKISNANGMLASSIKLNFNKLSIKITTSWNDKRTIFYNLKEMLEKKD